MPTKEYFLEPLIWLLDHVEAHETLQRDLPADLFGSASAWRNYLRALKRFDHAGCARYFRLAIRAVGEAAAESSTGAQVADIGHQAAILRGNCAVRAGIIAECWDGIEARDEDAPSRGHRSWARRAAERDGPIAPSRSARKLH